MNSTLNIEEALDLHRNLYRPDYKAYHQRVMQDCIGVDRWLELAEKAISEGSVPARYFSYLVKLEMAKYNIEKKVYKSDKAG